MEIIFIFTLRIPIWRNKKRRKRAIFVCCRAVQTCRNLTTNFPNFRMATWPNNYSADSTWHHHGNKPRDWRKFVTCALYRTVVGWLVFSLAMRLYHFICHVICCCRLCSCKSLLVFVVMQGGPCRCTRAGCHGSVVCTCSSPMFWTYILDNFYVFVH